MKPYFAPRLLDPGDEDGAGSFDRERAWERRCAGRRWRLMSRGRSRGLEGKSGGLEAMRFLTALDAAAAVVQDAYGNGGAQGDSAAGGLAFVNVLFPLLVLRLIVGPEEGVSLVGAHVLAGRGGGAAGGLSVADAMAAGGGIESG